MKIKRYGINALLVITALFSYTSCSQPKTSTKAQPVQGSLKKDTTVKANVLLKDTAEQHIYASYLVLKDALIKTDAAAAKGSALILAGYLNHKTLNKPLAAAKLIAGSSDIKMQRKEFTALSDALIDHFKGTAIKEGAIYIQHCPMANNGDGGDWLSSDKNIRNPYYGAEMLECGAVLGTLKAN